MYILETLEMRWKHKEKILENPRETGSPKTSKKTINAEQIIYQGLASIIYSYFLFVCLSFAVCGDSN